MQGKRTAWSKLQALVYDILPSTTAIFSYVTGSSKLSANEQFFIGVQTVVSLLQTTQIKQGVSFIATNRVYTSTNKLQSFESRQNSSFLYIYLWEILGNLLHVWKYLTRNTKEEQLQHKAAYGEIHP